MIKVLLADDQPLIRAGFKALLELTDDIRVVGEAADGAQAVALARRLRPDVALLDVRMPLLDGIQATRRIGADPQLDGTRVVILTNYALDEYVSTPPRPATAPAGLERLTGREREIVSLVGRGMSNEEIAAHLVISIATAKTHVSRAMGKLGVRDRAQLVVCAYEAGLVVPGGHA